MDQDTFIKTTISFILATGLCISNNALTEDPPMEKCYGIAEKGQNTCGTANHACQGQSSMDRDPNEWVFVPQGTCTKMGGQLK